MKNIIISGCPRSGKTTLANIIKREWPYYNIVHCDVIRNTFIHFIESSKLSEYVHNDVLYTDIVIQFINEIIKENEYPCIFEWSRLYPSIMHRINGDNIHIMLSLGDRSADELFEMCRKYDCDTDFTSLEDDNTLMEQCKRWITVNDKVLKERSNTDIFMETYENRSKALEQVLKQLKLFDLH